MPASVSKPHPFRTVRAATAAAFAFCLAVLLAAPAQAQLPQTRLYAVFPPGGQVGTSFDLAITNGADLDEVDHLAFSHPGIQAVPKVREANGAKTPVPNTFVVTIAPDVPSGVYEVRAGGLYGMSNPRAFVVGTRKEGQETEPNNSVPQATAMELETVMNGRSNSGADVDYYKFQARQGQRVLAVCQAEPIDSRMSATLEFYDSQGRRLDYSYNRFDRAPLCDVKIPADGEYFVKIYDFVYGGGNDHFYRLTVHTGPHIDFIVPPAGLPGSKGQYTLYGRNLPGGAPTDIRLDDHTLEKLEVEIALPENAATLDRRLPVDSIQSGVDGVRYTLKTPAGESNAVLVPFASSPVVLEAEPNNTPDKAQRISAPGEFAGQFQQVADIDYIEFEAKAKDVFWINVFSERMGTPADPFVVLEQVTKNQDGSESAKRLTAQDDYTTNLAQNYFDTLTDDPVFKFQAPADGVYRISLRDRYFESRGDPRLAYRVAIQRPEPDFRLVALPVAPMNGQNNNIAAPWSIGLRKGDNFSIQVLAHRRDGFSHAIEVWAEGLPDGVTCKGATIGPNQTSAPLIFTAAENAKAWSGEIRVVGRTRFEDPVKAQAAAAAQTALKAAQEAASKAGAILAEAASAAKQAEQVKLAAEQKAAADAQIAQQAAQAKTAADKRAAESAATAKQTADVPELLAKQAADAVAASQAAVKQATAAQQALAQKPRTPELDAALTAASKATEVAEFAVAQAMKVAQAAAAEQVVQTAAAAKAAAEQQAAAAKALEAASAAAKVSETARTAAVEKYNQAVSALQAAQTAKAESDQKLAAAAQAAKDAEAAYQATVRELVHDARPGTIVWNGDQNVRAVSRISHSLGLSVMEEVAPFQVTTDVFRVKANQGRQILIPVRLAKRNGFDNNVALAFTGQPKNVKVENKAIEKGKTEELLRVFIENNAPPGVYTLHLQAQGQVAYRRNPQKAERAQAAQAEAEKLAAAAAEEAKQAAAARDEAGKKAAADAESLKQAVAAQQTAEKKLAETTAAVNKAAAEKTKTDQAVAAAQAALKTAQEQLASARKAAEAAPEKADLKTAAESASKAVADAEAAAKQTAEKQTAATAGLATAQTQQKQAQKALNAATDAVKKAEAAAKTSAAAKAQAEAAAKAAEEKSKAAAAAKAEAEKAAKAAADAAKPKNVNVYPPSTPIIVEIAPAPVKLAASVPNGGALKRGAKVDVKVTVERINGFAGPVTLQLPLPPGLSGLSAEPVTVLADQKEGVLTIHAAADAPEGELANVVVRATADFNGEAAVDQPITIKVSK